MRQSIALVSALAGASFAQTQTIEFFFPGGYNGVDPVATIKTANPQTTAMRLACPAGTDSTECGFGSGLDYTIISGTEIKAAMTEEGAFAMSMGCIQDLEKKEASCEASVSNLLTMSGMPDEDLNTKVSTVLPLQENMLTAAVIEGADMLSATAAATGASSKSSGAASAASTGASGTASAGSQPTSSGATSTGTRANATGTGAAPESTGAASKFGIAGSALLALAGAAALNVL